MAYQTNKKTSEGAIRRTALLGPYGVGAIVPFPYDETFMVAGLDAWQYKSEEEYVVHDERLEKFLNVSELRIPPDYKETGSNSLNDHLTIPLIRFPTWYYCPFCGQMKKATYYQQRPLCDAIQWKSGRRCKPRTYQKMIPERFIVVCPEGHIDDFPVAEWVHAGSGHQYDPKTCIIRRSTGSASSGLQGVFYECTCGARKSMAGAFDNGALKRIGYHCRASKPWLGIDEDIKHPCFSEDTSAIGVGDNVEKQITSNGEPKVLLRGATNAWFANVHSSIYIPAEESPEEKQIRLSLQKYIKRLAGQDLTPEVYEGIIQMIASVENIDAEKIKEAVNKYNENKSGSDKDVPSTEDDYRYVEYQALIKSYGSDQEEFYNINQRIDYYDSAIRKYFKSISLVKNLKETRVFVGFSRLKPDFLSVYKQKKLLRLGKENWLPAVVTRGEGIFFEFNKETVKKWEANPYIIERIRRLDDPFKKSYLSKERIINDSNHLKPEFIMIHTFAHLMINQLSYECGYGSSSLRERIYCEKSDDSNKMHGVLIYTASGDSEGSMGGLVRQGEPGRLENTVLNAISRAEWCSADPVCIQSTGQGPESLNLAACHNCALLPETCCENANRLLDRGMIVGTLEHREAGYFSGMLDEN